MGRNGPCRPLESRSDSSFLLQGSLSQQPFISFVFQDCRLQISSAIRMHRIGSVMPLPLPNGRVIGSARFAVSFLTLPTGLNESWCDRSVATRSLLLQRLAPSSAQRSSDGRDTERATRYH